MRRWTLSLAYDDKPIIATGFSQKNVDQTTCFSAAPGSLRGVADEAAGV